MAVESLSKKKEVKFYDSPDPYDISRWDEKGHLLEKKMYVPEVISKEAMKKSQELRDAISKIKSKLEQLKKQNKG